MRAVIHAGLHKTGTSSFQRCCHDLREELLQQKIHYPQVEGLAHHNRLVDQADVDWLTPLVSTTRNTAGEEGCLLISAENLEYVLHSDQPERIEKTLHQTGINDVAWVLCFREPFAAYRSLYAQLSYSGRNYRVARAVLEFEATGHLIAAKGTFSTQNRCHLQRFHFNYPFLIKDLKQRLQGSIVGVDFNDFTKQAKAPGDLLIQALSAEGKKLSDLSDNISTHTNRSTTAEEIERNYVHRFFAFDPTKQKKEPEYIEQAIQARLKNRRKGERRIKRQFEMKLAGWEQAITPAEEALRLLRR